MRAFRDNDPEGHILVNIVDDNMDLRARIKRMSTNFVEPSIEDRQAGDDQRNRPGNVSGNPGKQP